MVASLFTRISGRNVLKADKNKSTKSIVAYERGLSRSCRFDGGRRPVHLQFHGLVYMPAGTGPVGSLCAGEGVPGQWGPNIRLSQRSSRCDDHHSGIWMIHFEWAR
jgi:hypothetical protein